MLTPRQKSVIGLVFFLIILPLGSYIFLKIGSTYRKDRLDQLSKIIPIEKQVLTETYGEEIDFNRAIFIYAKPQSTNLVQIESIYDQFKNRDDVYFVLQNNDSLQQSTSDFKLLSDGNPNVSLVESLYPFLSESNVYQMADTAFIMGDHSGYIRKVYPYQSKRDLGSLVEHVAMMLKSGDREQIIFQRENEK